MKRRIAALMLIMALIPTGIMGCGEEEVEEVVEEDVISTINVDVEDETDKLLQEQIDEYDSSLEEEKKKEPTKEEEQASDDTDIAVVDETTDDTASGIDENWLVAEDVKNNGFWGVKDWSTYLFNITGYDTYFCFGQNGVIEQCSNYLPVHPNYEDLVTLNFYYEEGTDQNTIRAYTVTINATGEVLTNPTEKEVRTALGTALDAISSVNNIGAIKDVGTYTEDLTLVKDYTDGGFIPAEGVTVTCPAIFSTSDGFSFEIAVVVKSEASELLKTLKSGEIYNITYEISFDDTLKKYAVTLMSINQ